MAEREDQPCEGHIITYPTEVKVNADGTSTVHGEAVTTPNVPDEVLRQVLEDCHGCPVEVTRQKGRGSSRAFFGLGGTRWNSSWKPKGPQGTNRPLVFPQDPSLN